MNNLPTQQDVRSRQTAMDAERHWWVQRLKRLRDDPKIYAALKPIAVDGVDAFHVLADAVDALIRERTT